MYDLSNFILIKSLSESTIPMGGGTVILGEITAINTKKQINGSS